MKIGQSFMSIALFVLVSIGASTPMAVAGDSALDKPCATTTTTAVAVCGRCGDGQCVRSCGETAQSCPRDCGVESIKLACGKCGDGRCTPQCGETAASCPKDCGVTSRSAVASAGL